MGVVGRLRGRLPGDSGWARVSIAVVLLALSVGCAARAPDVSDVRPGWNEEGVASWYGHPFHGRTTASGEVYDMERMTAAHRWLPFGTRLRVENRDNGRRAVVRVNDRGPFVRGRTLDVSRAAAEVLGMIGPGTARVRVTILDLPQPPSCLYVQAGAYRDARNVEAARRRLADEGFSSRLEAASDGVTRVLAGPFPDVGSAQRARGRIGGLLRACPPGARARNPVSRNR